MNIPEKVKIGYKEYIVNIVDNQVVSDNKVCYGSIEYDQGIINICSLYSEDQQKCTLIHEIVHGIDDIVEADLTEDQVRKIGKGLYQFLKENPGIFKDNTGKHE